MKKFLNKITCGDCLELMKQLPDNSVDLVLTDPPYGIGEAKGKNKKRGGLAFGSKIVRSKDYGVSSWDDNIPTKEVFEEILRVSKNQIIFGGNYFIEYLYNSSSWVVWDKDNAETDFADCELAWTSHNTTVRKFKWRWNGMLQEDMKNKEKRVHPTQKPIELMRWCLEKYLMKKWKEDRKPIVLDPFLGSGTTARACMDLECDFIGFEISPEYCEIARKRLLQQNLF